MNGLPLADCRILITRPVGQQQRLREAIEACGGEAISLPLLAIKPIEDTAAQAKLQHNLAGLHEYDLVIFVSANAARFGAQCVAVRGAEISPETAILAIGEATAREASMLLDRPVHSPASGGGSEQLLKMPQLEKVNNKKVAIFRGEGGRELLATELRRFGARVDYIEVYRRAPTLGAAAMLQQILSGGLPDYVVITSAEALQRWRNLLDEISRDIQNRSAGRPARQTEAAGSVKDNPIALPLTANERTLRYRAALLEIPVAAPSRRVADLTAKLGFTAVINAGDAGAKAIVEALAAHLRQRGN